MQIVPEREVRTPLFHKALGVACDTLPILSRNRGTKSGCKVCFIDTDRSRDPRFPPTPGL